MFTIKSKCLSFSWILRSDCTLAWRLQGLLSKATGGQLGKKVAKSTFLFFCWTINLNYYHSSFTTSTTTMAENPLHVAKPLGCVKTVIEVFDNLETFKPTVKPKTIKSARGCMQVERFQFCQTCHKIEAAHICSNIPCETIRSCHIVKGMRKSSENNK